MKSRTLSATALILLAPLVVLAFQAQGDQYRKRDLKSKPFTAGPLKITIISLDGFIDGVLEVGLTKFVNPIYIEVENTSDKFTTFDPRRLSLVDTANNQLDVRGLIPYADQWLGTKELSTAEERRMAPNARIKAWYELTGYFRLPVRLYYEDKLLATIIE
ncbi:MAG TPA: hypothetical protein VIC84_24795 [Blastocatellia bacterium]|jgi:hypothetical protein